MSYVKKIEYEIILKDSFRIIRNCSKCGRKTQFKNTKKFRINANGNRLDIWLIYQCEECRNTLNLAIYERQKVSSIPKEKYRLFLDNDERLAEVYGKSMELFRKNKADVDFDRLNYDFVKVYEAVESSEAGQQIVITVNNPYQLNIRPEKQIAAVLGLSRSQVKSLLGNGKIELKAALPQHIMIRILSGRYHMDE